MTNHENFGLGPDHIDMSPLSVAGQVAAREAFDSERCAVVPLVDEKRRAELLGGGKETSLQVQGAALLCAKSDGDGVQLMLEVSPPPGQTYRQFLELCQELNLPLVPPPMDIDMRYLGALVASGTIIAGGVSCVNSTEDATVGYGMLHVPVVYVGAIPEVTDSEKEVTATDFTATLFDYMVTQTLQQMENN